MIGGKLDKLNAREKVGLVIALLMVFAVAVDRLAIQFVTDQFHLLNEQIEKQSSSLKRAQRIASGERLVVREYAAVRIRFGQAISRAAAVDELKMKVDEMARESGVIIVSMKDRESPPGGNPAYEEYAIEIGRFEARIKELLDFLYRVRGFPGIMRVGKLTMAPDKDTGLIVGSMLISRVMEKGAPEAGGDPSAGEPR